LVALDSLLSHNINIVDCGRIVAIRDVEQVGEAAAAHGLKLTDQVGMPANNLLLHFVKE
jgi:hypothetical protein